MNRYDNRLHILTKEYDELISRENEKILPGNGVFERYKYPILTADHPAGVEIRLQSGNKSLSDGTFRH